MTVKVIFFMEKHKKGWQNIQKSITIYLIIEEGSGSYD